MAKNLLPSSKRDSSSVEFWMPGFPITREAHARLVSANNIDSSRASRTLHPRGENQRIFQRMGGQGIWRSRPRGCHQNSPSRGWNRIIPYIIGKLATNLTCLTRGSVKSVPGRGIFGATPSLKSGNNLGYPLAFVERLQPILRKPRPLAPFPRKDPNQEKAQRISTGRAGPRLGAAHNVVSICCFFFVFATLW